MMINREIKIWKINTSKKELRDIGKAWLVISVIFTVLHLGISFFDAGSLSKIYSNYFIFYMISSLFTVGIGFLFHEMAHKFMAQHYGCAAEFRADTMMLLFALVMALLFGFTFIAPGAVMIAGMITRKENGIISLVGPLTNYCLGIIFLILRIIFPYEILEVGFFVNFMLGLFNMLPFFMFDGKKIWDWSIAIWFAMVATGIAFLFFLLPILVSFKIL